MTSIKRARTLTPGFLILEAMVGVSQESLAACFKKVLVSSVYSSASHTKRKGTDLGHKHASKLFWGTPTHCSSDVHTASCNNPGWFKVFLYFSTILLNLACYCTFSLQGIATLSILWKLMRAAIFRRSDTAIASNIELTVSNFLSSPKPEWLQHTRNLAIDFNCVYNSELIHYM